MEHRKQMKLAKSLRLAAICCLPMASGIANAASIPAVNLIDYGYYDSLLTHSYVSQPSGDKIISEFSTTSPPSDYNTIGSLDGRLTTVDGAGISLVGYNSGTGYGSVNDRDYMVVELSEAISGIDGIDLKIADVDDPSLYSDKAAKVYYSTTDAAHSSFSLLSDIFGDTNNNGDIEFGDISGITHLRIEQDDFSSQPLHIDAIYQPEVAMVPIPAAAWLFGSGLLGLLATGRRRKK